MFSVVIPLYNKEKHISRTIDSVRNQTYGNFEIVIVDDGSKDKSLDIVKKIKDPRLKVLTQENKGVSSARNLGIKNSKYDYIAFLDADDQWNIDFLNTINNLIKNYPESAVFFTSYKKIKNEQYDFYLNEESRVQSIDDYFKFALNNQGIHTSSIVVKKKALEEAGLFDERFSRGEDLQLWTKLALNNIFVQSAYIGSFYSENISGSLTKVNVSAKKSFSSVAEDFYYQNKNKVMSEEYFRLYMSEIIITKAKYLTLKGEKEEARRVLNKFCTKYNKRKVSLMKGLTYLPKVIAEVLYN